MRRHSRIYAALLLVVAAASVVFCLTIGFGTSPSGSIAGITASPSLSVDAPNDSPASTSLPIGPDADSHESISFEQAVSIAAAEEKTGIDASQEGTSYISKQVLVTFKDGTTASTATEAIQRSVSTAGDEVTDNDFIGTTSMAVVTVAAGKTVAEAVAELADNADVAGVQPNYIYHLCDVANGEEIQAATANELTTFATINDARSSEQWSLTSTHLLDAWDYATCSTTNAKASLSVSVAIIDTGIRTTHEDLAANIVATQSVTDGDITDVVGHGTHVAGIAAGVTNNGAGIVGSSYNAGIVAVDACTDNATGSFSTESLVAAYQYILSVKDTYDIRVINMSVGGYGDCSKDDALEKEIDTADAAGILTVCAAGNEDRDDGVSIPPYNEYPGDYETCISVISLDQSLSRSSFSNYGPAKDISAPGASILSTSKTGNDRYELKWGTSMASPLVAGVAALVFSCDESLTTTEMKSILYSTSTDLGATGRDDEYGYGEINASAAVQKVLNYDIGLATVSVPSSLSYTGAALNPVITATLGGKTLIAGTDYTVVYRNAEHAIVDSLLNAGTYTATVTGVDASGYFNSQTVDVVVAPRAISAASAQAITNQTYMGSAITPAPVLTFNGATLLADTDYTLSYSNNVSVGTATITITGKGNFTSSTSTTFDIVARDIADASVAPISDVTYTGSAITPLPVVTYGATTLTAGSDYTLAYSGNTQVGSATITITGTGNYAGTQEVSFNIVAADIASATIAAVSNQVWTGSAITPAPVLTFNGATLLADTDYTLSYSNNVSVGTATITITGTGNFLDDTSVTFAIKKNLSSATVSSISNQIYTGSAITPLPAVMMGSSTLTKNTDYTLSYKDSSGMTVAAPTALGTYTIVATGIGNYMNTVSTPFNIILSDINPDEWYYSGGYLQYVFNNNLMTGYAGTTNFGPYDTITRGQVATILYRYACGRNATLLATYGSTTDAASYATTVVFSDEESSVFYTAAINWAQATGIMTGDSSTGYTTVRPWDGVTREELCTMIARFANVMKPHATSTNGPVSYVSIVGMSECATWSIDYVEWCASWGVIGGIQQGDGSYMMCPHDSAWRASMAKMITILLTGDALKF